MTFTRREQIMSKDIISTSEVAELLGKSVSQASRIVNDIKASIELSGRKPRINERGKIHTQDYCDYYQMERR